MAHFIIFQQSYIFHVTCVMTFDEITTILWLFNRSSVCKCVESAECSFPNITSKSRFQILKKKFWYVLCEKKSVSPSESYMSTYHPLGLQMIPTEHRHNTKLGSSTYLTICHKPDGTIFFETNTRAYSGLLTILSNWQLFAATYSPQKRPKREDDGYPDWLFSLAFPTFSDWFLQAV